MAVINPLLKCLKSYVFNLIHESQTAAINDKHQLLAPFCQTLENILSDGIKQSELYVILDKKESVFSISQKIYNKNLFKKDIRKKYEIVADLVKKCSKVKTSVGKDRFFIRCILQYKILLSIVKELKFHGAILELYTSVSVLGNEVLAEMFMSLLQALESVNFDLSLVNAGFLDYSWQLAERHEYQLVPCPHLGVLLRFIDGRALILEVEPGSVAAEDEKIEAGDIIDEFFGDAVYGWNPERIYTTLKNHRNEPLHISILKGHSSDKQLFSPLFILLNDAKDDLRMIQKQLQPLHFKKQSHLVYFGSIDCGVKGDTHTLESCIRKMIHQVHSHIPVLLNFQEMGLTVQEEENNKVIIKCMYPEVSACGRLMDAPSLFAFTSGETVCNSAKNFICHVLKAENATEAHDYLMTIGFERTHWAV